MPVSRRGRGPAHATRALASQVHPVFMLPPLAASLFGGLLAGEFDPVPGFLHVSAAFSGLYTAHVKDGYVDYYVRGEDDDHPMTASGCRLAMACSTTVFLGCLFGLYVSVDLLAVLVTVPGWIIAYLHAPQLDMSPVTATAGYPAGIALAVLGGFYVQARTMTVPVVGYALVFVLILSGMKIVDDASDYEYDKSIKKTTVAVALGPNAAKVVAYLVISAGLCTVLVFAATKTFPPSAVVAALAFGVVAALSWWADAPIATMLLIRGSYVFLALLLAAVWFRPLGQ